MLTRSFTSDASGTFVSTCDTAKKWKIGKGVTDEGIPIAEQNVQGRWLGDLIKTLDDFGKSDAGLSFDWAPAESKAATLVLYLHHTGKFTTPLHCSEPEKLDRMRPSKYKSFHVVAVP